MEVEVEVEVEVLVDWSELPRDILILILERLSHISSQYRFSIVCSSWRAATLANHRRCFPLHVPGLLIPGQNCITTCQTRRFLPFPVGKAIDYYNSYSKYYTVHPNLSQPPLLPIPHENLCCGSYEDWLVMVNKDLNMYLLNAFFGTRIDLPPITTLPRLFPGYNGLSKWYVDKAILSTTPSSSNCVVIIFYAEFQFAFCKVRDKIWSLFVDFWESPSRGYKNGIYYKEAFYLVHFCGSIHICNNINSSQPKITQLITPPMEVKASNLYLVESSVGGDLLLIQRKVDLLSDECETRKLNDFEDVEDIGKNDDYDYDNNYRDREATFVSKTIEFTIHKLDTTSDTPTWLEIKNLYGEALFLGINQSFSISESRLQELGVGRCYVGNRIYYTDDDVGGYQIHLFSGNDMGIYNLEDSTIEPLYLVDSESTKPHAIWITPKHCQGDHHQSPS